MATLTAANSVLMLGVTNLFPTAQQIQGFSTDDVFDTDALETVETIMGVDTHLSAGWVAVAKKMTVTLQADSDSNRFFDDVFAAQQAAREVFVWFGTISLPAIGRSYTLTRGFLTSYKPTPGVKKTLQARPYGLTWERIAATPLLGS